MDRVLADVHWLVEEIGPREPRSNAEQAAVSGVIERLQEAGWSPISGLDSPVACRGKGQRLFLAHVDSVRGSPGAIDNAGSVAVLLELARTTRAENLCLGFPVQEEIGLIGSRKLAHAWDSLGLEPLELVVAAEFIGDGRPTAMDLFSAWGEEELSWLVTHTDIDVPFRHHVVGRTMPVWRSDHAPFAAQGILSFNFINRSEDDVHTRYHQPSDDTVHPDALLQSAQIFEQLATAPPIRRGGGDPAFRIGDWVVPGSLTWFTIFAGLLSGLPGVTTWRASFADFIRTALVALLAGGVMWTIASIGFPIHEAEETAHSALGVPTSGWWTAAPWAVGCGWIVWTLLWTKMPGQGHPAFNAAVLCLMACFAGPLLALPFAMTALAVRVHRVLGIGAALLWLQPSVLREVTFHGLVTPGVWALLFLATWPAFGRRAAEGSHK